MKIDYTSDCHLDFWISELNPGTKLDNKIASYCTSTGMHGADVLIIAGDLGHYFVQDSTFLLHVKTLYKHVFVVTGNHDMYLVSNKIREKYKFNSHNRVNEMKEFCKNNDIHYLEGNTVEIEGVTFGGTGMSWDISYLLRDEKPLTEFNEYDQVMWRREAIRLFDRDLNDSRLIYEGKPYLDYNNPYAYHSRIKPPFDALTYFESEMNKLKSIKHADVIISHYGPVVPDSLPDKHKNDTTTFYYFDGSKEIERISPKFWIFGHTHDKFNFKANKTNFVSNPIGYPGENLLARNAVPLKIESFEL